MNISIKLFFRNKMEKEVDETWKRKKLKRK
jgi:hypothetical protein